MARVALEKFALLAVTLCAGNFFVLAGCGAASDDGAHDLGGAPGGDLASAAIADLAAPADLAPPPWTLTWSDEFDGPAGPVDSNNWSFDTGGDGWGNNELEFYTNRTDNAAVDGAGALVITTRAEAYQNRNYTSARLNTAGHFSQAYGRFEARVQIPFGQGLWPAFWTLGDNIGSAGWPGCGELDIMENIGREPAVNHCSAHGPGYSGGNPLTATYQLPSGALSDGYHVYAIEWEPGPPPVVRWYVDDTLYETRTPADVPAGDVWVYDHPFFIILNVAVGGNFPGAPDGTTVFPQTMKVDYVRVYRKTDAAGG